MARYVAKNMVAAKLADKVELSLSYVIGEAEPEAITINTFGTEKVDIKDIRKIIKETFSFSVANILEQLDLKKPQFFNTAAYGHFGRENKNFKWEKTDKVEILRKKAMQCVLENFK